MNSPNIKQDTEGRLLFETAYLNNKDCILGISLNQAGISKIRKQYVYCVGDYSKESVCASHNHQILAKKGWQKVDQAKQKNYHQTKHKVKSDHGLKIEASTLEKIKLLDKEAVYDITLHEQSNFLTHRHIVHNSIEQDADLVLMLYQNNEHVDSNTVDVVIAKHRSGPVGSFRLLFHADICKFKDVEVADPENKY